MTARVLHFIDIEVASDWTVEERDPEHGDVTAVAADPKKLPPVWAAALDAVLADVDSATCALADLTDEATGQMCSNAVGWVLHEDDDNPHASGVFWKWTTLVFAGADEGVIAVCEDCCPANLYEQAAAAQRVDRERRAKELKAYIATTSYGKAARER